MLFYQKITKKGQNHRNQSTEHCQSPSIELQWLRKWRRVVVVGTKAKRGYWECDFECDFFYNEFFQLISLIGFGIDFDLRCVTLLKYSFNTNISVTNIKYSSSTNISSTVSTHTFQAQFQHTQSKRSFNMHISDTVSTCTFQIHSFNKQTDTHFFKCIKKFKVVSGTSNNAGNLGMGLQRDGDEDVEGDFLLTYFFFAGFVIYNIFKFVMFRVCVCVC